MFPSTKQTSGADNPHGPRWRAPLTGSMRGFSIFMLLFLSPVTCMDAIRINCGGNKVNFDGHTFEGDYGFNTGIKKGKPDGDIYDSEREDKRTGKNLIYNLNVGVVGKYECILHFKESQFDKANMRKFNVFIQDEQKLKNFDIYKAAGNGSITKSFEIEVTDGTVKLELKPGGKNKVTNKATINAIEIIPLNPGKPSPKTPDPATTPVPKVTKLVLVDTQSNKDIQEMKNGDVIDSKTYPSISVRADADTKTVKSVKFEVDGKSVRIESKAPYALNGDTNKGKKYNPFNFKKDSQIVLTVTAYSQQKGKGEAGQPQKVTFTVMSNSPAPPEPKNPPPVPKNPQPKNPPTEPKTSPPPPENKSPPPPPPENKSSGWKVKEKLPGTIGETAAGIIKGKMYVVGEKNNGVTFCYDIENDTWSKLGTNYNRPKKGHHHAAEVYNDKLYLIGGLSDGSQGTIQIFDPDKGWEMGKSMGWKGGSVNSALIGNKIYVCGGIVGSKTVNDCGIYDPEKDSWSPMKPMPDGRNHAAAATDGKLMYVFGGRTGKNTVTDGFDDVQIYDPDQDAWKTSKNSKLKPLPQKRGGTGKGVCYKGNCYVLGGETSSNPHPSTATPKKVYDRVDIYNTETNTWTLGKPMPVALHGTFPLLHNGMIIIAGGGTKAANSQSDHCLIYTL